MNTGQLFMQVSVNSAADFSKPASTSISSGLGVKSDSGSFDRTLREAMPQRYSKSGQTARTDSKHSNQKDVEQAAETAREQKTDVVLSKDSNGNEKNAGKSGKEQTTAAEKALKDSLQEATPEVLMPQNVDMSAAAAQIAVVQQSPEGRMPQSDVSEETLAKVEVSGEAQNATRMQQLAEVEIPQQLATMSGLTQAGDKTGTQKVSESLSKPVADVAVKTPAVDTLQADVSSLVQNPVSQINTGAGLLSLQQADNAKLVKPDGIKELESVAVGQIEIAKAVSTEHVEAATKTDATTLKPVLKQDMAGIALPAMSVQVDNKLQDDTQSAQKTEKTEATAATAGFRFSRSASVEASVGMVGNAVETPKDKLAVTVADNSKIAAGDKAAEGVQAGFNGSGSDFSGKDAEEFAKQNLELPKPVLQQVATNGQVAGTTGVSTANTLQAVLPEQVRTVNSENVAGQVKTQLSTRDIKQGSEQITIQLSPDHLGDIKVNFRLEDQRLKVEIVAENRTARESLLQHADSLKESLARQNITMDKFEVTGGNSGSANQGGNSQPEWQEMAKNRQSQQWLTSGGYRTTTETLNPSAPVYFARTEKTTLDLHF